jgi:hypothetical protein
MYFKQFCLGSLLLLPALALAENYTFTILDVPTGLVNSHKSTDMVATGINNLGQVVGYFNDVDANGTALMPSFIYQAGEYKPLIDASGQVIQSAYGINDKAQVSGTVAKTVTINLAESYVYNYLDTVVYDSTTKNTETHNLSYPFRINNEGEAVTALENESQSGLVYAGPNPGGANYLLLNFPSLIPVNTINYDLNDSGVVVGTVQEKTAASLPHGFIYDGRSYTQLDVPGATETVPYDVNNVGLVAGSYKDAAGKSHGFVYDGKSYNTVDAPGSETWIFGLNDGGQLVGAFVDAKGKHGFLANPAVVTTQQAVCKTNATFGIWSQTLSIKDVELAGRHYAGKLHYTQNGVNSFELTEVNEAVASNCTASEIARYTDANKELLIPSVSAYGSNFQIRMRMQEINQQNVFEMVDALKP